MTITWDEVLSKTDLVDELVPPPMPKLKKLLSEPTVFDRPTPPPLVRHPLSSITQALEAAELGGRIYDGLEPTEQKVVWERGPFQAPEMAKPRILEDGEELTDADRRLRAARAFGIDPSTMTDDRLEGLR